MENGCSVSFKSNKETPLTRDESLTLATLRLTFISEMHFLQYGLEKIVSVVNSGFFEIEGGNFACAFCTHEEKANVLLDHDIRHSNIIHKEISPNCPHQAHSSNDASTEKELDLATCFDYKRESHRRISFLQYALPWVCTVDFGELAAAGFYYMGPEDNVICFFCRVQIKGWETDDKADTEHKRWSPSCPMVTKEPTLCNVPLTEELEYSQEAEKCLKNLLACENARVNMRSGHCLLSEEEINSLLGASKYPEKQAHEERLKTFNAWPLSVRQTPESLASAGFYSVGDGDKVLCFHCGLGIMDFAPTDDPFEEHAKWNPICTYVILEKGMDFVKGSLRKNSIVEKTGNQGIIKK
ncbi:death-associated inhibitor of apoptosis 1-like [Cloeon dipterum]|uniref:death-associated inhibitor of apoptosis 1-like n=1 Tax=Cloeon dipterum TaxID=197152 RepID=UPI00321FA429